MKKIIQIFIFILFLTACSNNTCEDYAKGYDDGFSDGKRIGTAETFPDAYNKGHEAGVIYCELENGLIDPSML